MSISRRKILILLVTVLFTTTFVSWAYGKGLWLDVNVDSDSQLAGGKAAVITPISKDVYTLHKGRAHKLTGIALYKIEFGNSRYTELAKINLTAQNISGGQIAKQNWIIRVGVYYQVPDSTQGSDVLTIKNGGSEIRVKRLTDSVDKPFLHLTRIKASGYLRPDMLVPETSPDQNSVYIIASYTKLNKDPNRGSQKHFNKLTFHCIVRM